MKRLSHRAAGDVRRTVRSAVIGTVASAVGGLVIVAVAAAQTGSTAAPLLHAVALESGMLRTSADATAPAAFELEAGRAVVYLGRTTDAFGREWSVVGDPEAWARRERWFAIAASTEEILALDEADLLTSLPTPRRRPRARLVGESSPEEVLAAGRQPVQVGETWWRSWERQTIVEAEVADLLGAEAYRVAPAIFEDAIELLGGRETLGPWPEAAAFGRLHRSPLLPVVWRHDGADWEPLQGGIMTRPVLGLLGNPMLGEDVSAPRRMTGAVLPCWNLVGGIDPAGRAAGLLDVAPEAPARIPRSARRQGIGLLGLSDIGPQAWPVATERLVAPRRVVPELLPQGALLQDNSARQAVYLEQVVPASVTARLRGREMRLQVFARIPVEGETATTSTVAIELVAGSESIALSAPVGVRPTPLSVNLVIPEDAEEIRVRLIPLDHSIAVAERGRAIFERVSLAPSEWPTHLEPTPLFLRRVRIVTYEPARRFTRAAVAVSERPAQELEESWRALAGMAVDDGQRLRILAGELQRGMPREQVLLAWGQPDGRADLGAVERWDWAGRSAAFNATGALITWTRTDAAEAPEPARCLMPVEGR